MTDRDPPLAPDLRQALDERLGEPRPGDEQLLARVRARVMQEVRADAPFRTVRADAGEWQAIAPGVQRKLLWVSGQEQSALVRMAPGARVPGHHHPLDEECVVLEGSLRIGADLLLQTGDFHVGRRGSTHGDASTETGALVYLRGAVETA